MNGIVYVPGEKNHAWLQVSRSFIDQNYRSGAWLKSIDQLPAEDFALRVNENNILQIHTSDNSKLKLLDQVRLFETEKGDLELTLGRLHEGLPLHVEIPKGAESISGLKMSGKGVDVVTILNVAHLKRSTRSVLEDPELDAYAFVDLMNPEAWRWRPKAKAEAIRSLYRVGTAANRLRIIGLADAIEKELVISDLDDGTLQAKKLLLTRFIPIEDVIFGGNPDFVHNIFITKQHLLDIASGRYRLSEARQRNLIRIALKAAPDWLFVDLEYEEAALLLTKARKGESVLEKSGVQGRYRRGFFYRPAQPLSSNRL